MCDRIARAGLIDIEALAGVSMALMKGLSGGCGASFTTNISSNWGVASFWSSFKKILSKVFAKKGLATACAQ